MKQHAAFGDEEYYHYAAGAGLLWNFDGKRLIAGDQTGKTIYDFTMAEWYKANHLKEERKVEGYNIVPLTKKKAIFNLNLYDQDRVMSYIVDLKTKKAEKSFHQALYGCYYDGDFYHFDTNKNTLEIIDLKTGETKEKLDYSSISEGAPESITYLNYDGEMQGFVEVEESKGEETISYCVNPNTGEVYLSYFNGVYHYNKEKKTLEKIVEAKDLKYFPDMFGNIEVGADGRIYMLGFIGGGDDEGPNDFLYMTPA